MVCHACNPHYSGGRNKRIVVRGQPGKVIKTLSQENKPNVVVYICNTSYLEDRGRRITIWGKGVRKQTN
jgi:hypothetical protein